MSTGRSVLSKFAKEHIVIMFSFMVGDTVPWVGADLSENSRSWRFGGGRRGGGLVAYRLPTTLHSNLCEWGMIFIQ
jgi:hypothetical protein